MAKKKSTESSTKVLMQISKTENTLCFILEGRRGRKTLKVRLANESGYAYMA